MEIRLLGAPQLRWEGQPWTLPRRQVYALLYRLAAEPTPRSRLAFLFWPDEPDTQARRHLTRLLSASRAALVTQVHRACERFAHDRGGRGGANCCRCCPISAACFSTWRRRLQRPQRWRSNISSPR